MRAHTDFQRRHGSAKTKNASTQSHEMLFGIKTVHHTGRAVDRETTGGARRSNALESHTSKPLIASQRTTSRDGRSAKNKRNGAKALECQLGAKVARFATASGKCNLIESAGGHAGADALAITTWLLTQRAPCRQAKHRFLPTTAGHQRW